jgi:hypothetical protein
VKRTSLDPHSGHGFSGSAFSKPQSGQVRRGDKVLIVASRSTVPRDTRYALVVLFAINALNFFDRQVLSAVGTQGIPGQRRDLGAPHLAGQTAFTCSTPRRQWFGRLATRCAWTSRRRGLGF